MLKITFSISCFLLAFSFSSAQIIGTNTKKIDADRYSEIKSSPYFYKDWQAAILIDKKGNEIEDIEVNYNGYTNEIEAKVEGGFVALEANWYPKIVISKDATYFQYSSHPRLQDQYIRLLYIGEKCSLLQSFVVTTSKRKVESPGKTIVMESFVPKKNYYLLEDGVLQLIKMKKKDILKLFPQKEIATFVSKNKLKLNSEEELIKLLVFAEDL